MAPPGQLFKIKLSSGRILGPIDLKRIRRLILNSKIIGTEVSREYPQGEWKDINLIAPIAELLMAHASGTLKDETDEAAKTNAIVFNNEATSPTPSAPSVLPGANNALPVSEKTLTETGTITSLSGSVQSGSHPSVSLKTSESVAEAPPEQNEEKTQGETPFSNEIETPTKTGTKTEFASNETPEDSTPVFFPLEKGHSTRVTDEKTILFQNSSPSPFMTLKRAGLTNRKNFFLWFAILVVVGVILNDFLSVKLDKPGPSKPMPFRPTLPSTMSGKADPAQSTKSFGEALPFYLADTVSGYKAASKKFLEALQFDNTNVRAIALLSSSYLNLIDSSNKDENYFSVITKLLDQARAKSMDLPETVIADVEFYLTVNRTEAAHNRIVEYTKFHKNFDLSLHYYLSLTFLQRGDAVSAASFILNIPENKIFSARVYYLRGQIAEKNGDSEQAQKEYLKAIQFNPKHGKSILRLAELLAASGKLREATPYIELLVQNVGLLNPKELARTYSLHAQIYELARQWDLALGAIERAVKLDKNNHDYLLELYTLRAKAGESLNVVQKEARMYFFLSEGEKALKLGRYQEALALFLQARQSNLESTLPLIRIGDMFTYLNDVSNAKLNYELAAKRAPKNVEIWSKYINILIQSYDWEEAEKAMNKFRMLPVSQSAIDKAAGDMYARQGRFVEAQSHYKRAMARDSIDPTVYVAYAKSLLATQNYKDAPFFFALALRYDPLNLEAMIGTAKSVAGAESIDRGISILREELQRRGGVRAELLVAIAELEIQRGRWEVAQNYVDQAIEANPEYAYPWKLQGQIYMNREGLDKEALDKALSAYKSYSDRNSSDPSGYLERYRVYIKKAKFEKASDELARIFMIYPKFPNLHFYKGALYKIMGNHKAAVEEFSRELKNNPSSANTMMELGKTLIELGSPREALDQFTKVMQLAMRASEPKHWAAYSHYLLKNYTSAIALYQAALTADPGNPLIYKRLGLAYWDSGDQASAKTAFRKYLEMDPDAPDRAEFEKF